MIRARESTTADLSRKGTNWAPDGPACRRRQATAALEREYVEQSAQGLPAVCVIVGRSKAGLTIGARARATSDPDSSLTAPISFMYGRIWQRARRCWKYLFSLTRCSKLRGRRMR